ncbi:pirin family protein [Pseudomonas sp. 5P_3.1_Bac2]|uniref:pirin family protein n=1 Tax=Pseudomonas sp. 5P_3.1_Bac2 TaxID=2971617 RepID=UPI0021C5CA56|nr:pirin family protein [Pseudomonas sp. 5P_3.1_Bac2]MCU1716564.1 pirin family protein [Pseudomonas sp. 5P_3.1_Bac2]
MIEVRPFAKLGAAQHGWLNARHHFSFSEYYDPERMNWGALRVWNDDEIAPNTGFPAHPHRDMEIITYVRQGAITHEDSLGNKGRTVAGDVQVMSAGTGIYHSEGNMEETTTSLFQIWIQPNRMGLKPSWGTKRFPTSDRHSDFVTLASGYAEDEDALKINSNARLAAVTLQAGQTTEYALGSTRKAYLVAATGAIEVNGVAAQARDGVAVENESVIRVTAQQDSEIILVDLA